MPLENDAASMQVELIVVSWKTRVNKCSSRFVFSMCNPPFYGSQDEVSRSADAKEYEPNAVISFSFLRQEPVANELTHKVCTGADVEMITPGGESNFVSRMVRESVGFGIRCKYDTLVVSIRDRLANEFFPRWYTSMLGKMSSLTAVVALLRQLSVRLTSI